MISNLHFISQETPGQTHLQCIEKACAAGVKWVQLRVKDRSIKEIIAIALQAKDTCDSWGAKLIINDHPLVAKEVDAFGLHLGKEDISVNQAREIVGDKMIIGGTANTIEDIITHTNHGANYIGCGPFRFTKTKVKLSPILGLDGYRRIISEARKLKLGIPIIAIGGIATEDIVSILETGVYGIAVSSLIAFAEDPHQQVTTITQLLKGENSLC